LRLARSADLFIQAIHPPPNQVQLGLIVAHLHHTRELYLTVDGVSIDYVFSPAHLALQLRVLSLAKPLAISEEDAAEDEGEAIFHSSTLAKLFSSTAPNLRTIMLHGFLYPWNVSSAHLETLTIENTGRWRVTLGELLRCLQCMPKLCYLSLSRIITESPTLVETDIIYLPDLMYLALGGAHRDCFYLLRHLHPHLSAAVEIHTVGSGFNIHEVVMSTSRYINKLHSGSPPFTSLELPSRGRVPTIACITFSQHDTSPLLSDPGPNKPRLTLRFSVPLEYGAPAVLDTALRELCGTTPLEHLRRFSVVVLSQWSEDDWASMFKAMTNLTHLQIDDGNYGKLPFLWSSMQPLSSDTSQPTNCVNAGPNDNHLALHPPLPALTHLLIRRLELRPSSADLVGVVSARADVQYRLQELRMEYCLFPSDRHAALRNVVDSLVV
jgi:hypothetical protein